MVVARPFLKWAGGKAQLLDQLEPLFPPELRSGYITRYVEPFVGGGAVFFYIAETCHNLKELVVADINEELVLAYRTIQRDVKGVIDELRGLEETFHGLGQADRKEFFYATRERFNETLGRINFQRYADAWIRRTAEIIFLNRTCFNGLFRVNSRGHFNVPYGDYLNPRICDPDNLRAVAGVLMRTEIRCGDFTLLEDRINERTFVYLDPPYRPISKTASFTAYSRHEFDDKEQRRLAARYASWSARGARLMLSNSEPKNEDPADRFFERLYRRFLIVRIYAARAINANGKKRGKIKELVIMNYDPDAQWDQAQKDEVASGRMVRAAKLWRTAARVVCPFWQWLERVWRKRRGGP